MNLLSFSTWLALGDLTVPGLTPQESAALVLLAASLLVFRAFRERYPADLDPGLAGLLRLPLDACRDIRAYSSLSDSDLAGRVCLGGVPVRGRDLCLHPRQGLWRRCCSLR